MKIIDRMVLKDFFPSFFLALSLIIFVLLVNRIFELVNLLIGKGIPFLIVLKLFIYNLPFIIFLSIPMSVLVSTIMTFGRMSADLEIIALKSSGINPYRFIINLTFFSIILFILTFLISDVVVPYSNHKVKQLFIQVLNLRPAVNVEKGIFKKSYDNEVHFYFDDIKNDNSFLGCNIIKDRIFIKADSGHISMLKGANKISVYMKNGEIFEIVSDGKYKKSSFSTFVQSIKVSGDIVEGGFDVRGDREMSVKMLVESIKNLNKSYDNKKGREYDIRRKKSVYRYLVEIHKKFSISFGVFAFVLLGGIIGIRLKRSSLAIGFTISTMLFVFYYVLLVLGEQLSDNGFLNPVITIWFPNILTLIFCFYFIFKDLKVFKK
ncbi:MAG: LptF/LptG family permease [candidate division WOR-3 bacterium]